jgi:hypothetical protein
MPFFISPASFTNRTLLQRLTDEKLLTNLKLCLDAGDSASYSGTGQSWLDTSGNGHDFFRGTTSGSQASDPTFNGTAGARTAANYWLFDGGDIFTYYTTNETWMQNLHKNNAAFSFAAWMYAVDSAINHGVFATAQDDTTETGVVAYLNDNGTNLNINFIVRNAGAAVLSVGTLGEVGGGALTSGAWNYVSMSLNEATGAGGILWNCNGTAIAEVEDSTYSSPATGSASQTMTLGTGGGSAGSPMPSGSRYAMLAMWEGTALTAQQLDNIFQVTRGRFGV